jgi:hypothetical protein
VGLRCKADDRLAAGDRRLHRRWIGDVAQQEAVAAILGDVGKVVEIAGVGQLVETNDLIARRPQQMMNEVRADESGPAGDEDLHRVPCCLSTCSRTSVEAR